MLRKEKAPSPELEESRTRQLDVLREYWQRGEFPKNTRHPGLRVPYFVDDFGTPCAVGYLLLRSGKTELVKLVRGSANHIYIDQITDPEFLAWAASSGLSLTELELIQPTYEFMRKREEEKKIAEEEARKKRLKNAEDNSRPVDSDGYDISILERVKKKIKEKSSDITGTEPLEAGGAPTLHELENPRNTPSTVTLGMNLRAKNNEKHTIEWGDKKESMVPDCWSDKGCLIENSFSHTYFTPGTYQIRVRTSRYDCKPEANSRCEAGTAVTSFGPGISFTAK